MQSARKLFGAACGTDQLDMCGSKDETHSKYLQRESIDEGARGRGYQIRARFRDGLHGRESPKLMVQTL